MKPVAAEYPSHWEADVVLRDGRTCHVRPILPEDAPRLVEFHSHLSEETIYFRYFAPYPELTERDVERFVTVDNDDRVALVATEADQIIAVARYDRIDQRDGEVAFTVRDDHQGRGLGAVLLEHLAAAAWERGLRRFVAEVLPNNRRMLATFREAGYAVSQRMEDGVYHVTFELEPTDKVLNVRAAREHRADARSVERLLNPHGVAVIGASRTPGRMGHELLRNLRDYGSPGPLYAIHPEAESILDVPAFPHITDIPQPVDLAVVAVPAESVLGIVNECAEAGVSGLVVISSGFSDTATDEGRARQRELVRTARERGMRVVGPNCLGLINTDPRARLNATISSLVPRRGRVGVFCQSGALGVTVLENVVRRGIGLTSFVSAGNRADVSTNDLLQYWEADQATSLVLLYLESIGNPRKFTRITRRLSRLKPVVAVRSGRYLQTLPLGHLVRRTTLPPAAVDAVFEQSGVVQTSSLSELFDVAALLAYQPMPRGDRVAVLGTSGALEILASDAVETMGLTPAGAGRRLPQSATPEEIHAALTETVTDARCDAVVFVHIPSVGADQTGVHEVITQVSLDSTKPIVAVMPAADGTGLLPAGMGVLPVVGADGRPEHGSVPTFTNVEDAVRALVLVRGYARWRDTEIAEVPEFPDVDTERASALVAQWLGGHADDTGVISAQPDLRGGSDPLPVALQLDAAQVRELLGCFGIRVWEAASVGSEDEAVAAAERIGYPVVLKTTAPWLTHRAELGSVRLNLESERAARTAWLSMVAQLDDEAGRRLVVQSMAPPGVPVVIGAVDDPLFGPVVRFGLGGMASELLGDEAYRIPPLSLTEARRLISTPKAAPLLRGYKGTMTVDVNALAELVSRVGLMVDEMPSLASVDLNPVIVTASGVAVLGARASVRQDWRRVDVGIRRLLDA